MALFNNLFNNIPSEKKYVPQDIREAYSAVLYCCAVAEGKISDEEISFIDCLLQTIHIFREYDGAEYLQIAEKAYSNYNANELIEGSFSCIKQSLQPQLFCYCCDIFLADGVMTEEEKKILEKLAGLTGLDEKITKKIVEVALIRNIKDE